MQYSAMPIRTVVERGPKGKRVVAFSLDWPGWSRGAKTPEAALETLEAYRERYRPIASLAGLATEFDAAGPLELVEDRVGTGSVDEGENEIPQKSTEPVPTRSSTTSRGPAASNAPAIPDRAAIGR